MHLLAEIAVGPESGQGPPAHAPLAPSLQAAHDFVIAFGDSHRKNESVPGADTHTCACFL